MAKNKFYVTTPLYYVNAIPHLGTLYSTILADVVARFNKLQDKEVFFLTGTDEHGQKIQEVARAKGMEPKDFVDSMLPVFKKVWQQYEINYDKFIRTTDEEHQRAVFTWIKKLQDQGDIYSSTYTGWYCISCESFVSVDAKATKNTEGAFICSSCSRPLKKIAEENYFFRLSSYQDRLLKFYEEHPNFIVPKERMHEVVSFVKAGLEDLSISRTGVTWGVPFPGDSTHTVYVWADALINYISAIGYGRDNEAGRKNVAKWWPADLHIIGKDIIRFHAVYWPAFLMAAGVELPRKVLVHGFILIDKEKMSKSRGNIVDPSYLAATYGTEPVRYYLMRQMSIHQDGTFDQNNLEHSIISDLANNLGNLLNRMLSIAINNGLHSVKPPEGWEPDSLALHRRSEEAFRAYWDNMVHYNFHLALADLWKFISEVNAFFNAQEPWKAAKSNKELFSEIISATAHCLYAIGVMAWPVLPKKMETLFDAIGQPFSVGKNYEEELRSNIWDKQFAFQKIAPLFVRPELSKEKETIMAEKKEEKKEAPKSDDGTITIHDVAKVQLHVGKIIECGPVEGSEKLYRLLVDLGNIGKRQIIAGVRKHFDPDYLMGKQGIFIVNLKPRTMLGLRSEGMMLFAKDTDGTLHVVNVVGEVENGAKLC